MAASQAIARAMRSPSRTAGKHFGCEQDADNHVAFLKAQGRKNVRKARYLNFVRSDGQNVFCWVVRCNA